ncbi:MAG TPA: hypothetical protein ENJ88_04250 [Phaeodactylibacter sp.]|nr:hypothetical protein [Phaeodactylibacter sp.]
MKTFRILITLSLGLFLFTFSACEQEQITPDEPENQAQQQEAMSEDEAVEAITKSIATEDEGMSAEANEAITSTDAYAKSLNCGDSGDTSFVHSYQNDYVTATYNIQKSWELICENGMPVTLHLERSVEGQSETPQATTEGNSLTLMDVTHLLSPNFVIVNGTRDAAHTRTSVENPDMWLSTTMSMNFIDIKVKRAPDPQILAGEATFVLEAANSNGDSRTFEGNIIFLGDQTAVLTINGHSRIISW